MHLRPFTEADWPAICHIHDVCKPDEMRGSVPDSQVLPIQDDQPTIELYRQSTLTVAEEDGTILGFTGAMGAYVSALCVLPAFRNRGIATALMKSVIDRVAGPVCLNVGAHNEAARRLYEQLGFAVDVEFVGKFNGHDVVAFRMRYEPPGQAPLEPTLSRIKLTQRRWATERGIRVDADGYCCSLDDNLFGGLSEAAKRDFTAGDGDELGTHGRRGKMQALHSSSALACNWFDFWRDRDCEPLSRGLGISSPLAEFLGLEQKRPTGVGGTGPNLDALLRTKDGALVGVESKFTEPYVPSSAKTLMKERYFRDSKGRQRQVWSDVGLDGCQQIAQDLRSGAHGFETVDVSQLLKHILALGRTGEGWILYYIWYDARGPEAQQHRRELQMFADRLGADAGRFRALSYRELFFRMLPHVKPDASDYMTYLRQRYVNWTA